MKYKAGFIGAGNMGGALLRGVAKVADKIAVFDVDESKAKTFEKECGCEVADLYTVAENSEFLFLAVKPNVVEQVCSEIRGKVAGTVVSMAAGVDTCSLKMWLDTDRLIRIMPNTPAGIGKGVILYTPCDGADEQGFIEIMRECGIADKLPERLIDAGMAISGCGPAFVYMFIEALADGAVSRGLPRDKAELYAKHTVLGAAELALASGKHPGKLKDEVCSPGGTTIEGVLALEKGAFRATVADAVRAAYDKTKKL